MSGSEWINGWMGGFARKCLWCQKPHSRKTHFANEQTEQSVWNNIEIKLEQFDHNNRRPVWVPFSALEAGEQDSINSTLNSASYEEYLEIMLGHLKVAWTKSDPFHSIIKPWFEFHWNVIGAQFKAGFTYKKTHKDAAAAEWTCTVK